MNRQKTLAFLDALRGEDGGAVTLYLPAGITLSEFDGMLASPGLSGLPSEVPETVAKSPTGAVLFWGVKRKDVVLPPVPITGKSVVSGYETGLLSSLIGRDYSIALVLVRLGSYAIGVCQGEKLVASKVGTGLVHARHRQGGSSAGRFARHREKQIEGFLTRVCGHVREKIEPYARTIDYITYGGARETILSLKKHCSFLQQFEGCTLPPLLAIPDPRQAVLEDGVRQVWSSQVIKWVETGEADTYIEPGKRAV